MKRIDTATAVADLFGTGKSGFTDGNPLVPTPATQLSAAFFNLLQEELCRVIEAGGGVLDGAKYDQLLTALRCSKFMSATAAGTANALTADFSPDYTAWTDGMPLYVRAASANTSTTPTIAIDSLAAKTIVKGNGLPLAAGDIVGAGHWLELQYDATLDKVVLQNPATGVSPPVGLRNRLINGWMAIDQEFSGASTTFTTGAALKYAIDQWYAYCTGANVTGQRLAGTSPNAYKYQFAGAASVTKIGFAQRIEAANSQDLAGNTATLSVELANSLLTTVSWVAYYANTADTFGTLASPTRTQIATGSFTVNSTLTKYSTQISIPSAATTGVEIEFNVGAQTSGTWTIGRAQLEKGSGLGEFEFRPIQQEELFAYRYFYKTPSGFLASMYLYTTTDTIRRLMFTFPCRMRIAPIVANTSSTGTTTASDVTQQSVRFLNSIGNTTTGVDISSIILDSRL